MSNSLKNRTIVITRSAEQVEEPVRKLESLGAKVIPFPTLRIFPLKVFNLFDTYTKNLEEYDYIVFTSENAVKFSLERLNERNVIIPENMKIVCVGEKTAEKCEDYNVKADIVPLDFSAKGLLEYFSDKDINESKFFIPSSSIARTELKAGLIKQGADVVQTPIYDVGLPDDEEIEKSKNLLETSNPDLFIFTSPSTFQNFIKILDIAEPKVYFEKYSVAAIGPTTASAIRDHGIESDIVPQNYTMDDLIDSIIYFYSN